jgi:hypothetical protein
VGKLRTTTQNHCTAVDFVSTPLVNPVVNELGIEGFPLIPRTAENRPNQAAFVQLGFPVTTWSVFLSLWTDALPGGYLPADPYRPQGAQKNPPGEPAGVR